jgi:hypothetical protein
MGFVQKYWLERKCSYLTKKGYFRAKPPPTEIRRTPRPAGKEERTVKDVANENSLSL